MGRNSAVVVCCRGRTGAERDYTDQKLCIVMRNTVKRILSAQHIQGVFQLLLRKSSDLKLKHYFAWSPGKRDTHTHTHPPLILAQLQYVFFPSWEGKTMDEHNESDGSGVQLSLPRQGCCSIIAPGRALLFWFV